MRTSPPLSTVASRIRPPVFSDLQARIDRMTAKGEKIVPLHIGDTYLAPPAEARKVLTSLDGEDASLYRYGPTAGVAALREAFAKRVGRAEDEVLVGNGGTHALFCAARAILDAGDEVILASPYWPLAPGVFTSCGAIPVEAPVTQALYEDPSFDVAAALRAKIGPRTKALYVISPNNPDGKVLTRAELEGVAALAVEHDLWVFSDEVYADVVFDGREHVSIATLPGMAERTVVLHSLSKSHALAGCRVGFAIAPAHVVAAGRRVSTHSAFNVSVAMQRAAIAALSDREFPSRACATYQQARDAVAAVLRGHVDFHLADGATYLFLDFGSRIPPGEKLLTVLERAVDRGVLLAPGDAFGDSYGDCARLCFTAAPLAEVVDGCERLLDALASLRK